MVALKSQTRSFSVGAVLSPIGLPVKGQQEAQFDGRHAIEDPAKFA